jgi:hypothetical protein
MAVIAQKSDAAMFHGIDKARITAGRGKIGWIT